MTDQAIVNQNTENKPSDKELNFRNLEARYQKELDKERSARLEAEKIAQEAQSRRNTKDDEDEDSDPYVDHKKLERKLNRFGEQTKQQTKQDIQSAVQQALSEERKQNWMKNNPDFYDVLQHADRFAQKDPDLAESILEMPEGFERQKLVYKNIKALGLHKPEQKQPSIQEKVDANRRSPYYQPSGVGTAPYASAGDFSSSGQKNAYDKMQALKATLRI
jgi:actin-related protein